MTGVRIEANTEAILDVLQRLYAATGDLRPALKNIGEYEAPATKDRIAKGVTPEGLPFAPLDPLYAATKKGPGILRGESGDLASIVYQLAGDDSVEIGNDTPHGAIHQFGGVIRPKNAAALVFSLGGRTVFASQVTIPARPYLGVSEEDEREILAIVADYLDDASGGVLDQN